MIVHQPLVIGILLVIRLHRMHRVQRCGLLLPMFHVCVSVCVCVLVTTVRRAKMTEQIEMGYGLG